MGDRLRARKPYPLPREPAYMHSIPRTKDQQQERVSRYAANTDSQAFFNLLTGAQLLEKVESVLPEQRKREFPTP